MLVQEIKTVVSGEKKSTGEHARSKTFRILKHVVSICDAYDFRVCEFFLAFQFFSVVSLLGFYSF